MHVLAFAGWDTIVNALSSLIRLVGWIWDKVQPRKVSVEVERIEWKNYVNFLVATVGSVYVDKVFSLFVELRIVNGEPHPFTFYANEVIFECEDRKIQPRWINPREEKRIESFSFHRVIYIIPANRIPQSCREMRIYVPIPLLSKPIRLSLKIPELPDGIRH